MPQGWQLLDLYCKGVWRSHLSLEVRSWCHMQSLFNLEQTRELPPSSCHAYMMAVVFGCMGWVSLCTSDWEGTMYLKLASGSHQSSCLSFPSAWNIHLSHVMIFEVTDWDYADSTQCSLYTLKIPFCLDSGFQTQSLSWFAFAFSSHVFKLPICVI